jgi:hypothetical protein
MAQITVTLEHTLDNGETSKTSTTIAALGATQASVLEQIFVTQMTQSLLRIGRYNAIQRDKSFDDVLKQTMEIASKAAG